MFLNGGMIPFYFVVKSVGLENSLWSLILPTAVNTFNLMILRVAFASVPDSLEESAKLDGCSDLGVFFRIILPISKPVISVIALFKAVYHWNDWFSGAYYIKSPDLLPVQTLLQRMLTLQENLQKLTSASQAFFERAVTGESLKMATIIISIIPIVCVYPFIQKYFVKGLMLGSVKE